MTNIHCKVSEVLVAHKFERLFEPFSFADIRKTNVLATKKPDDLLQSSGFLKRNLNLDYSSN